MIGEVFGASTQEQTWKRTGHQRNSMLATLPRKELLAIQEYFLKLEGRKLPAGEIIDHALEQLANDIGALYGLPDDD